MGDVAQILSGITTSTTTNNQQQKDVSKSLKLTGMSREVLNLVSGSLDTSNSSKITTTTSTYSRTTGIENTAISLPPVVPSIGNTKKGKGSNNLKPARKWVWAPFTSSARSDGLLLYHFVRAGVEYPDYPYARFDIHMDGLEYTNEEYEKYLSSKMWSKSETDRLVELVKRFELRWPVIYDRWIDDDVDDDMNTRSMEELQHRYYTVASILTQQRVDEVTEGLQLNSSNDAKAAEGIIVSNLGTGSTNTEVFNLQKEIERKKHLNALWNRTKEEEEEEALLKQQLNLVELQIRKLKKAGLYNVPTGANAVANPVNAIQPQISSSAIHIATSTAQSPPSPELITANILSSLDPYFKSAGPVPSPGIPYLQSHRCITPATGGSMGLNKSLVNKMETMLKELNVSSTQVKSTPTKRVCDLYDVVRKNVLTMLMLQKVLKKKEGEVLSRKNKLLKITEQRQEQIRQQQLLLQQQAKAATVTVKPTTQATTATATSQKATTTQQPPQQPIQQKPATTNTKTKTGSKTKTTAPTPKTTTAPTTITGKKAPSRKRPKKSEDGTTKPRKKKVKSATVEIAPKEPNIAQSTIPQQTIVPNQTPPVALQPKQPPSNTKK